MKLNDLIVAIDNETVRDIIIAKFEELRPDMFIAFDDVTEFPFIAYGSGGWNRKDRIKEVNISLASFLDFKEAKELETIEEYIVKENGSNVVMGEYNCFNEAQKYIKENIGSYYIKKIYRTREA